MSTTQKLLRAFTTSAACLLVVTGFAKIMSAFGTDRVLSALDPITRVPFRWMLLAVAGIELGIVGVCLWSKDARLKLYLLAWLSLSFLVYRLGLVVVGYKGPCPCMGNLTSNLHVAPQLADGIMKSILSFLLIGSLTLALLLRADRKRTLPD